MPWIALAAAGVGAIGNIIANQTAADRASTLQDKAFQEWLKVNIPDPEEQKLALQQYVTVGKLSPQMEKAISQDPTAFKDIVTSASQKSSQNRALAELENLGYSGGLNLNDKASLQDSMLKGQAQDRANREGITADMNRRGLGGSGFEFASQLGAQQSGADRDAQNSLSVAARAQDRALQSIMGAGDMATKLRSQDYSEQAQKAAATDSINRFNTQALQDLQTRNIGSQNRAAEMNLAQQQKTNDSNTSLNNYQQEFNKNLLQKQFENESKIAAGKTGQYNTQANQAIQQGQQLGNTFSNLGSAGAAAATSQANADYWDKYFSNKGSK